MPYVLLKSVLPIALVAALAACGEPGETESGSTTAVDVQESINVSVKAVGANALARDTLVLLVPDGANESDWPVKVWVDTAIDEGYRIQIINDATFLSLGATSAQKIKALMMPDSAHSRASDALIAALTQYVEAGGSLLLTYDAGILTETGFYAPGKSRLSALAGVDYGLYDTLLDQMVGLGPVVGTKDRLGAFNFPPGKYVTFTGSLSGSPALKEAKSEAQTAKYLPTSPDDPGGLRRAEPFTKTRPGMFVAESRKRTGPWRSSGNTAVQSESSSDSIAADPSAIFVSSKPMLSGGSALDEIKLDTNEETPTTGSSASGASSAGPAGSMTGKDLGTTLETISGYGYSAIQYYTYVTRGVYQGTAMLASPTHGIVAGWRTQGAGKVMFVNIPLGYFKAIGTDSAPIHGSLSMFARNVASMPRLSSQPRGVGGLIYNWHIDDGDDLTVDAKWLLDNTNIFKRGPYSIHFTAGPDVNFVGDGLGMDLPNRPAAQDLVRRLGNLGGYAGRLPVTHTLGSHGGWNHNLYGNNADETNQSTYQPWLTLNANAVKTITGKSATEYSAPQGNNSLWSLNWLQSQGVKAYYYAGDIGVGAVRAYRDGALQNPSMWAFPVTPFGKYATFEEFEEFGVSDAATLSWLKELQDFVVNKRTNRLFYNHPPGARNHVTGVLEPMLARADTLQAQGSFKWYTMTEIANFMARRNAVTWNVVSNGARVSTFSASHASDLSQVTLLVPRNRYNQPSIRSGSGSVRSDATDWIVTVNSGKAITFSATER